MLTTFVYHIQLKKQKKTTEQGSVVFFYSRKEIGELAL